MFHFYNNNIFANKTQMKIFENFFNDFVILNHCDDQGDEPFFLWFLVKPSKTICFLEQNFPNSQGQTFMIFANFVLVFIIKNHFYNFGFLFNYFSKQKIPLHFDSGRNCLSLTVHCSKIAFQYLGCHQSHNNTLCNESKRLFTHE